MCRALLWYKVDPNCPCIPSCGSCGCPPRRLSGPGTPRGPPSSDVTCTSSGIRSAAGCNTKASVSICGIYDGHKASIPDALPRRGRPASIACRPPAVCGALLPQVAPQIQLSPRASTSSRSRACSIPSPQCLTPDPAASRSCSGSRRSLSSTPADPASTCPPETPMQRISSCDKKGRSLLAPFVEALLGATHLAV